MVAGQRGFIILELQHHIARPRRTFHGFVLAAAHQIPGAVFRKDHSVLGDVFLVAIHVVNIDARDPVALCHLHSPVSSVQASACTISATMASAAALGSAASMTGLPTTR